MDRTCPPARTRRIRTTSRRRLIRVRFASVIDARDLHGSGPHLDNLETREERLLIPGVGFSIEPGVYMPGKIGMRSEVNVFLRPGEAVVTPRVYQTELIEV